MKKEEVHLAPGVYFKGANTRTLLGVFNGKCVYGHGVPKTGAWPVTSCSIRTFVKSVGALPTRRLTVDEAISLAERMQPYSCRRQSNRWERATFHSDKGRFAILAALEPAPTVQNVAGDAPAPAAETSAEAAGRSGLMGSLRRLFQALAKLLGFVKRGFGGGRAVAANPTGSALPAAASRFIEINS